ncbi:cupin domain-containing protein [Paenibacillus sp. J5C_2022]|uniref:cupin domain-containing protein n=1 Tax=Paenibacillus sp. J5C2022 TaxID=2977129 RepID=UPI0021D326BD|nr:cupin domain-containing protein [Paenibacillus sp. J5C2022]MCU6712648.1 cupin domain-containing protein [Paenibacillus sp. J5C2022]
MSTTPLNYASPSIQYAYNLANNPVVQKDSHNYYTGLTVNELNSLGNTSLLDIYMTAGNVIEPHYHQNASELVYGIIGTATVSLINPFTNQLLSFRVHPGTVVNIPQGWWHYIIAESAHTHMLAIFDAPVIDVIFGSDILRLTPPGVLAHTYCLNEAALKEVLAPLQSTVAIGPPEGCMQRQEQPSSYRQEEAGHPDYAPVGGVAVGHDVEYGHHHRPQHVPTAEYPFHPIPFLYRRWV